MGGEKGRSDRAEAKASKTKGTNECQMPKSAGGDTCRYTDLSGWKETMVCVAGEAGGVCGFWKKHVCPCMGAVVCVVQEEKSKIASWLACQGHCNVAASPSRFQSSPLQLGWSAQRLKASRRVSDSVQPWTEDGKGGDRKGGEGGERGISRLDRSIALAITQTADGQLASGFRGIHTHTHLPFGNTTAPPSQWSVLSNYSTDHPRFGLPFQSEPEMANERNGKNTKEEAEKEAEKGGLHTVQSWPTQDGLFHGTRETPRNPL